MILAVAAAHAAETPAPAASLLLPRFEVSLQDPLHAPTFNTTFTVTNAGAVPQIIRMTFFTDRGFAVLW